MNSMLIDAWFNYGTSPDIASVRAGTRPGDSLADLVFSFLFAEVSKRIRQALEAAGIRVLLPWSHAWLRAPPDQDATATSWCSPLDVTWMDDLSVLLWAASPSELVEAVRTAATVTIDESLKALLLPNLGVGKSESIVNLIGPGSLRTRKALFGGSAPSLPLVSDLWVGARLRLVPQYKHLGGLLHWSGGLKQEAKARIGAAWSAFRRHRRQVFGSPIVPLRDKAVLFTTLIESVLYFGVGAWPGITESCIQRHQATLVAIARNMLRPLYTLDEACHLSAQYVLSTARILSAGASIHVERLRHFKSVVAKATPDLWALLRHERSWLVHVQGSLAWMRERLSQADDPLASVCRWEWAVDVILRRPDTWKRHIRRARCIALLEEHWQAEVVHFQGLVFRALVRQGARVPTIERDRADNTELCGPCQVLFCSLREWSHHAFKRHGRIRHVRNLVDGQQCPVCLRQFACNARVCQHLEHAHRCRWALLNAGAHCPPQPGVGHRQFNDGKKVLLPATQAAGPHGRWDFTPCVEEKDRPSDIVLRALEDLFWEGEAATASYGSLLAQYCSCFRLQCLQRSRLRATAVQWRDVLCEALSDVEDTSVQWAGWHLSAANFVVGVDFVSWLGGDAAAPQQSVSTFRDATRFLPLLDTSGCSLPSAAGFAALGSCFLPCLGALPVFGGIFEKVVLHASCLEDPGLVDFARVRAQDLGLVYVSCVGILAGLETPYPLRSFRNLEAPLKALRLLSDLTRGVLYLWAGACPAILVLPEVSNPAITAVVSAAPFCRRRRTTFILSNFPLDRYPDNCFTL